MTPANEASETAKDIVERLRASEPLPVCPFDRRSPDYWTAGENGAPCTVCGGTEDGPDKCRGADSRIMVEAAAEIERLQSSLANVSDSQEARLAGMEDAAKIARDRQAICQDAVDQIMAGKLYPNLPRAETAATERCAMMEARHIAKLIEDAIRAAAQKEGG